MNIKWKQAPILHFVIWTLVVRWLTSWRSDKNVVCSIPPTINYFSIRRSVTVHGAPAETLFSLIQFLQALTSHQRSDFVSFSTARSTHKKWPTENERLTAK